MVTAVDADVIISINDVIVNTPDTDLYTELKKRLIETHAEIESSKIRTLLYGLEFGNQRPSQLLARMHALAGSTLVEGLLLKSL